MDGLKQVQVLESNTEVRISASPNLV
jgi:hypothetical protein